MLTPPYMTAGRTTRSMPAVRRDSGSMATLHERCTISRQLPELPGQRLSCIGRPGLHAGVKRYLRPGPNLRTISLCVQRYPEITEGRMETDRKSQNSGADSPEVPYWHVW